MYAVEVYARVRQLVFIDGLSRREVARRLGLSRDAVSKMCRFSDPPGYVRTKPVARPVLARLVSVIDANPGGGHDSASEAEGFVKRVVISAGAELIARHERRNLGHLERDVAAMSNDLADLNQLLPDGS